MFTFGVEIVDFSWKKYHLNDHPLLRRPMFLERGRKRRRIEKEKSNLQNRMPTKSRRKLRKTIGKVQDRLLDRLSIKTIHTRCHLKKNLFWKTEMTTRLRPLLLVLLCLITIMATRRLNSLLCQRKRSNPVSKPLSKSKRFVHSLKCL